MKYRIFGPPRYDWIFEGVAEKPLEYQEEFYRTAILKAVEHFSREVVFEKIVTARPPGELAKSLFRSHSIPPEELGRRVLSTNTLEEAAQQVLGFSISEELAQRAFGVSTLQELAMKILEVDSPIEGAMKILGLNSPVELVLHFIKTEEQLNEFLARIQQPGLQASVIQSDSEQKP